MKKIVLSVLLVSMFYQLSNAQESGAKDSTNQSVKEESTAKVKENKEGKEVDSSSKQDEAKSPSAKDEAKESQNKEDDEPHYKGKWKYASKTQMTFYVANDGSTILASIPYALGFSYRFLDQLKISAYIGLGLESVTDNTKQTKSVCTRKGYFNDCVDTYNTYDDISPYFVPIDVTLAYSLTNFHKVGKNLELVVGAGYDVGFNPIGGFKVGGSKLRLEAGLQLGRTLGLRFSYIPALVKIGSKSESFYGASIVFAWKN